MKQYKIKMKESKPLWEIVGVLWLTISILTIYSFIDYKVEFGVELKKSELKAFLTKPIESPFLVTTYQDFVTSLMQNILTKGAGKLTQKIDSSSQTILLTGDSMCEGLMFRFKDYASYNKHQLKTVIWYSSTTVRWSESDSLRKLIDLHNPSYILFTTGSNELFIRNIEEREKHIQNIIQQAGNTPFIWIGPPNWAEDTGINDLIVKNIGKDRYFESKKLTFQRASDGAHPTWRSAAIWADSISSWLMSKTRHKILMNRPIGKSNVPNS